MQQGNLIDNIAAELSGVGRGPACVSAPADDADTVDWLYSNVRGLRQAAGELSICNSYRHAQAALHRSDINTHKS